MRGWRPSPGSFEGLLEFSEPSDACLELGLSQWKVQALTALKVREVELRSMFLKKTDMSLVTKLGSSFFQKLLWLPSKSRSRLNPAFRSKKLGLHCSAGDCRLMKVLKYRSLPFLVEAITRYPYAASNLSPSSQTQ